MGGLQKAPVGRGADVSPLNLQTCPHCRASVSPNAERCPKCFKAIAGDAFAPCRTCGTKLEKDQYYTKNFHSYVFEGTSHVGSYWSHKPCPNCGDPKPLNALEGRRLKRNSVVAVVLFFVFARAFFFVLSHAWRADLPFFGPMFAFLTIADVIVLVGYLMKYVTWSARTSFDALKARQAPASTARSNEWPA